VRQLRTTRRRDYPGAFCAALLSVRGNSLPPEVHTRTSDVAQHHVARTHPTDLEFRRLLFLARRAALRADRDAGVRVATVLLREWERYAFARLLGRRATAGKHRRRGSTTASPRAAVLTGQPVSAECPDSPRERRRLTLSGSR
jgi:hypothetical protein